MKAVLPLLVLSALAVGAPTPDNFTLNVELGLNYQSDSTEADSRSDMTYTRRYSTGYVGMVHVGTLVWWRWLYAGIVYEQWAAGRTTNVQTDNLVANSLGPEFGVYVPWNPRVFWMVRGAAIYPMQLKISSTAGDYTPRVKPVMYQGRATLGINLGEFVAFLMEIGYRRSIFGDFKNAAGSQYTSSYFDLSGYFLGLGIAGHF